MNDTGWIKEHSTGYNRFVGPFMFSVYQRHEKWHVFANCGPIHFTKSKNFKYEQSAKRFCETLINKLTEESKRRIK